MKKAPSYLRSKLRPSARNLFANKQRDNAKLEQSELDKIIQRIPSITFSLLHFRNVPVE